MKRKRYKKTPVTDMFGFTIGYECKEKGIKIVECEKREADAIIVPHHYSHKVTQNSFRSFLVYYNGKISGAMQLGYGIRPVERKLDGLNRMYAQSEVRDFDRMWLSDDMPKFSETITLSLLHRYLREMYPNIKVLISYADTSVGNNGTIYKAANYVMIDKLKADFYLIPIGGGKFERLHPVTAWHRHKTRAWDFMQKQYPGIKKAEGWQLKFAFYL